MFLPVMVFDLFARSHKHCRPGHVSLDYAYQTRLIDVSQLRHLDGDSACVVVSPLPQKSHVLHVKETI